MYYLANYQRNFKAHAIDFTKTAESPTDVGYWSDEWCVGGKFGAKIQFGSSFRLMHHL
ncbi:hypothetical protein [Nostoc sp. UHCC 0251]|uniref:hypothetical protein n=1 Tax=Nostoc sp. UHCC 0251 TaxID=3110240 RepID=UPI002B1FF694|nr:hypothetical protein [Nostoc sp. UHCC 0251]MEA5623212.1 hypothetical protein [Nostoc sp. UHCC 0251]